METEWDRLCARTLIASNRSDSTLKYLGIDASKVSKNTKCLQEVLEEEKNAFIAASDMISLRPQGKSKQLTDQITNLQKLKERNEERWTTRRLEDVQFEIEQLHERVLRIMELEDPQTPYQTQKLRQNGKKEKQRN